MEQTFPDVLTERGLRAWALETGDQIPPILHHFTDATGLAGMMSHRELWVSRAQNLNDASEVRYALDLGRDVLRAMTFGDARFRDRVLACLDGNAEKAKWNVIIEPFVASFCADIDGALHWLHYGRAGSGYAIGFEAASLVSGRFTLRRVLYDQERQKALLAQAIGLFQDALAPESTSRQVEQAAVACAVAMRSLAARIKSPYFRAEDEWRLITLSMQGALVKPDMPMTTPEPSVRFRAANDRVIPFVPASFGPESVHQVVLGYSVQDTVDEVRSSIARAGRTNARVFRFRRARAVSLADAERSPTHVLQQARTSRRSVHAAESENVRPSRCAILAGPVDLPRTMDLLEVSVTEDVPSEFLARVGQVFVTFDARTQDSGNVSYGVKTSTGNFFVKTAGPPNANAFLRHEERISWLRNAVRLNALMRDPVLCTLRHVVESPHGPLLVYDWAPGELVGTVRALRTDPASAFMRFKARPLDEIARALTDLFRVHHELCGRGWIANDFYDGAMIYDFASRALKLIDLDMYRDGPFINDMGRLFGSDRFMAPEEFELGARIDEATTVFTMGRCIHVFLGERDPGSASAALLEMLDVGKRACQTERNRRWLSMREFFGAWLGALRALL